MAIKRHTSFEREGPAGWGYMLNEASLRSEIGFWRELIDSCPETQSPESIERMSHALALAETRLAALMDDGRSAHTPYQQKPSNVYSLDIKRNLTK